MMTLRNVAQSIRVAMNYRDKTYILPLPFFPPFLSLASLLLGGLCVCCGCHRAERPRAVESLVAVVNTAETEGPLRYISAYSQAAAQVEKAPITFPVDDSWRKQARPLIKTKGAPYVLQFQRSVTLEAAHYTTATLRMRATAGSRCILAWRSDLDEGFSETRRISHPIVADGEWRDYSFSLASLYQARWQGRIQELRIIPSDQIASVEVASLTFSYRPSAIPPRVHHGESTLEALFGTLPPWSLQLPEAARFEAHAGVLGPSNGTGRAKVVFRLDLIDAQGAKHRLLEHFCDRSQQEADEDWRLLQADLGPWSGQAVQLLMSIDHLGSRKEDYAFWGAPMVYSRAKKKDTPPLVLYISCDTLSAKHLSCYGYPRETSPFLDRFAADAVVFEQAVCQETWTLPSHISMLTGLYPKHHRVDFARPLAEETMTLADALRQKGYLCAGYTGYRYWLDPSYGFHQGFDIYNTPRTVVRNVFDSLKLVETWLDRHPDTPQMIFFHNFDIHNTFQEDLELPPYQAADPAYARFASAYPNPQPFKFVTPKRKKTVQIPAYRALLMANSIHFDFSEEERNYVVACYDDAILAVDAALNQCMEMLREKGLYDDALIIVSADHGEEFGERDFYMHQTVYQGSTHVPLIIKFPQQRFAGARVKELVQLVDIVPTVLDLLGHEAAMSTDGQSLIACLEGREALREEAYIQRDYAQAAREGAWKLIRFVDSGAQALYDVEKDEFEQENRLDQAPPSLSPLAKKLEDFYQPDLAGWRFRCLRGASEQTLELHCETPKQIQAAHYRSPEFPYWRRSVKRFEQGLRTLDYCFGAWPNEEMHVATLPQSQLLSLRLESDQPIHLYLGSEYLGLLREKELVLDSALGPYPEMAPSALLSQEAGVLAIWYEAPQTVSHGEAKTLSAEDQQALEALGYLQ